jgi:hypothetical protein
MLYDEWDVPGQVDWQPPFEAPGQSESFQTATTRGAFPEVEIGSSSDEDAPRAPESTKLARENLQLRTRVQVLMNQSKSLEQQNDGLKRQLTKYRHSFASQMKSKIKSLFK